MRTTALKRTTVVKAFAACIAIALVTVPGYAAPRSATEVSGSFVSLGGVITGHDPETGKTTGVAAALASGDWNGYWYIQLEFIVDLETGDATGTALQIFTGSASDGTSGSLTVLEDFFVDGSTHILEGEGTILGGSGDWEGSRGRYFARGTISGVGPGEWSARWIRPSGRG